ncbi:ABC transporter ATP-binding protein [Desulfovibrio intestinalis]|uniref:Nickel transport system ATP-binding protein n=1 Tax=Desulfovibrio intestinalis TaxID=58621 RepID=A0A7W8C3I1_9BACT|nr:ABC transporter ATP-binding protein [Desulfovibrio intestinalis]MBB5143694.1 nickel transport system ATP-binding protein [Desulfovibrio intestinalis]
MTNCNNPVFEVRNLHITHPGKMLQLVHDLNFTLDAGTCLGIVGESGSGKTLVCRSLMGLLPPTLQADGTVIFEGMDLLHAPQETMRSLRGSKIAMVMQQPMTAFDPLYTLDKQFLETMSAHGICGMAQAKHLAMDMLERVCIANPETVLNSYPHQLSGGMLQRCMIALALIMKPASIIADEPTTALDAETQYEVVQQFFELRKTHNTAMIFVSHDLGIVQRLADELLVMKDGECVESGRAEDIFNAPQHPYTQYLIRTRMALTKNFKSILEKCHA